MTSHDKFELLWGSTEIPQNIFDQNDFAKQLSIKLSVHPSYLEGSEFQNQNVGAGIAKVCFKKIRATFCTKRSHEIHSCDPKVKLSKSSSHRPAPKHPPQPVSVTRASPATEDVSGTMAWLWWWFGGRVGCVVFNRMGVPLPMVWRKLVACVACQSCCSLSIFTLIM